jgi:hypothetical protein
MILYLIKSITIFRALCKDGRWLFVDFHYTDRREIYTFAHSN